MIGGGRGRAVIGRVTVNNTKDVWKKPSRIILFSYLKLHAIHRSLHIHRLNKVIPLGLTILPAKNYRNLNTTRGKFP